MQARGMGAEIETYRCDRHNLLLTKAQFGRASSRSSNLSIRCLGPTCCCSRSKNKGAPFKLCLGGFFNLRDVHSSQTSLSGGNYSARMPWGLKRFQQARDSHFLTFSCYKRRQNFGSLESREIFESALERVREQHALCVYGYVVMPEHVHLLVSEPECGTLAQALQSMKQGVARRLALRAEHSFWQARYYDFNVWTELKFTEKLLYIHRNPVKRGLVEHPQDWEWSSFHHYLTGDPGTVEIESHWTATIREKS